MKKQFRMTDDQLTKLLEACRPVPYMVLGGYAPPSPQENANAAWCSLGDEMGFDGMTVEAVGEDMHDFIAEPKAVTTPGDTMNERIIDEKLPQSALAKLLLVLVQEVASIAPMAFKNTDVQAALDEADSMLAARKDKP